MKKNLELCLPCCLESECPNESEYRSETPCSRAEERIKWRCEITLQLISREWVASLQAIVYEGDFAKVRASSWVATRASFSLRSRAAGVQMAVNPVLSGTCDREPEPRMHAAHP